MLQWIDPEWWGSQEKQAEAEQYSNVSLQLMNTLAPTGPTLQGWLDLFIRNDAIFLKFACVLIKKCETIEVLFQYLDSKFEKDELPPSEAVESVLEKIQDSFKKLDTNDFYARGDEVQIAEDTVGTYDLENLSQESNVEKSFLESHYVFKENPPEPNPPPRSPFKRKRKTVESVLKFETGYCYVAKGTFYDCIVKIISQPDYYSCPNGGPSKVQIHSIKFNPGCPEPQSEREKRRKVLEGKILDGVLHIEGLNNVYIHVPLESFDSYIQQYARELKIFAINPYKP